jgi:PUA domain protein
MKRFQLRSKDLTEKLTEYNLIIDKKQRVELIDDRIILIDNEPSFFYYQNNNESNNNNNSSSNKDIIKKIIPTLKYLQKNNILKTVTIDMGAVKFIINGADIMRPGIKELDQTITKDDFVAIIDINNKKPIAIGLALYSSSKIQTMTTGKVIKNIHYVGDELWKFQP